MESNLHKIRIVVVEEESRESAPGPVEKGGSGGGSANVHPVGPSAGNTLASPDINTSSHSRI